MRWSDIPTDPTTRTLRQFAGLWLILFGAAAAWQGLARGRPGLAALLGVAALAVGIVGLIRPGGVRWIYVGGVVAGFPIGWAVSQVVLALIFFAIFTPVALVFRLLGRDPLRRQLQPDAPTYWEPRPPAADPKSYFHQY